MAADQKEAEGQLSSTDGTRLFWRSRQASAPRLTLAVVHGLGEHSGRYRALAEAMSASGVSTYALDLRGMGRSDGRRGRLRDWQRWLEDFSSFLRFVGESSDGEVVPLGHSFGGVVVLSAVIRRLARPLRLVVSNPALRPAQKVPVWKERLGSVSSRLLPDLTLPSGLDAGSISRDPEVVRAYREDPLVHDRISSRLYTEWTAARQEVLDRASLVDVPALVICSSDDHLIDPSGSRELARRLPRADLKEYPGRYHEPFNDLGSDEVFADLAGWLLSPP